MASIFDGTRAFHDEAYPALQKRFEELANGQWPEVLFITCSDSRIVPSLVTQTGPGDLFISRNAGNLVPVHGEDDNSGSAVEYAVAALKVKHIVVCGHSGCGALTGLLNPESLQPFPTVARWVAHAEPTAQAVAHLEGEDQLTEAIRHNAVAQLDNLKTHPSVAKALEAGELTLHAWVYDIPSGTVEELAQIGPKDLQPAV